MQAVSVARAIGKPVQVMWSREEDIQHDFYRPAALVRAQGGARRLGQAVALRLATASQSILARVLPAGDLARARFRAVRGHGRLALRDRRIVAVEVDAIETAVPVGCWRSVGHSITAFAKESFIDEMAHEAGVDPLDFRLALLADQPRLAALLKSVAKVGLGRDAGAGPRARRCAAHFVPERGRGGGRGDGRRQGALKVDRVVAAVDCGTIVNPDIVRAQVEGAIVYGLSAALFGKITIKGGRVEQENFPDYDVVHMSQAPRIEVHLMPSDEPPGGIGEPGLPPLAPGARQRHLRGDRQARTLAAAQRSGAVGLSGAFVARRLAFSSALAASSPDL